MFSYLDRWLNFVNSGSQKEIHLFIRGNSRISTQGDVSSHFKSKNYSTFRQTETHTKKMGVALFHASYEGNFLFSL